MQPFDLCRFTAYRPNCCDQARATDGKTSTLATLDTPLRGCDRPDECPCMVSAIDPAVLSVRAGKNEWTLELTRAAPPEPATNVIPIARGRRQ